MFRFFEIYNNILKNTDPSFLNEKRLSEALYGDKPLSNEEQIFLLLHYYELRRQSGIVTNLQRSLNSDTKKVGSYYSIVERQELFEDAKNSGMFNIPAMERMRNDSTIKAFTNDKTGFDAFVSNLYHNLFEVTNHPVFNKTIRDLIKSDNDLNFEFKFSKLDKLVSTLKNDFITYLYQNYALDENEPLFQKTKALFLPKTSIAKELQAIKSKYPNLSSQFPILNLIIPDNLKDKSNRITKVNLKLKYALKDKDQLDDAVNQVRNLLAFTSPKYTIEQQIEIQKFAKTLTNFLIIQSGLNPSVYNLLDIVPNEAYTTGDIKNRILDVRNNFNKDKDKPVTGKDKSPSSKAIQKFYNRFKLENPNFFTFKFSDEEEIPPLNFQNSRGKNYFLPTGDITGEKQARYEQKLIDQAKNLPNISKTIDSITGQKLKKEPNSLFVVSEKEKRRPI